MTAKRVIPKTNIGGHNIKRTIQRALRDSRRQRWHMEALETPFMDLIFNFSSSCWPWRRLQRAHTAALSFTIFLHTYSDISESSVDRCCGRLLWMLLLESKVVCESSHGDVPSRQ